MQLRPQLLPPPLDEALVARLADLAANLDGDPDEDQLAEFNQLAGTDIPMNEFQGIYGSEEHEDYVRRVLYYQLIKPVADVTRAELVEVARRAMSYEEFGLQTEVYQIIFEANVPRPAAANLIYYPPDYDAATNTWGDGRPMGEYDPTPEQIVEWALTFKGKLPNTQP